MSARSFSASTARSLRNFSWWPLPGRLQRALAIVIHNDQSCLKALVTHRDLEISYSIIVGHVLIPTSSRCGVTSRALLIFHDYLADKGSDCFLARLVHAYPQGTALLRNDVHHALHVLSSPPSTVALALLKTRH